MGEKYRFFDSIDGEDERFYTADEFAEYFRQFIRNGIFNCYLKMINVLAIWLI